MSTLALIIGIDDYAVRPLQGAVADATRFRDALARLELADEFMLLTSEQGGADDATFELIRRQIVALGREGNEIERLIFYFAGHGILTFRGPGTSKPVTALLPSDVVSLEEDGNRLLVVEDVLSSLRLAGPREQFYFLDACRDMPYERNPPEVGSLGFHPAPAGAPRSQSVLYAVSELGRARASQEGGEMTGHLIDALEGKGRALDYSLEHQSYVVTIDSVANYVRARLAPGDNGRRAAGVPSLTRSDPPPGPLRLVDDPPPRKLVVRVDPAAAGSATEVEVGFGDGLTVRDWPPESYGEPVELPPRLYQLAATSSAGAVDPSRCPLDVREVDEATVRILSGPPERVPQARVSAPWQMALLHAALIRGQRVQGVPAETLKGWLSVKGPDGFHAIDVTGLEPPYERAKGFGELDRALPPGTYQLDVRLGPEVVSSQRVFVGDGSEVEVDLPVSREPWADRTEGSPPVLLRQLARLQLMEPFFESGPRVRLIVAIEESEEDGPRAIAEMEEMTIAVADGFEEVQASVKPRPAWWGAVGISRLTMGETPFEVELETPRLGRVHLASAALEGHRTAIVVRIGRNREVDVSQYLVRPWKEREENLQRLQLAQQLYKSGELLSARGVPALLKEVAAGEGEPLLACMALYALESAAVRPLVRDLVEALPRHASLPDTSVALSMFAGGERADLLDRSAAELAAYAVETGRRDHPLVERRAWVPPGQSWNLSLRRRPDGAQIAEPTGTKALQ
jgi:hypothetical protein